MTGQVDAGGQVVWLALLPACDRNAPPDVPVPNVSFESVVTNIATVRWSASEGSHWIAWGEALEHVSPSVSGSDPSILVLGLPPGAPTSFQAHTEVDGVVASSEIGVLEVPLPEGLPPQFVQTHVDARSQLASSFLAISLINFDGSWITILDGLGRHVWTLKRPFEFTAAWPRPGRDHRSLLFQSNPRRRDVDVGTIERVGLDGSPVASMPATLAHHAFMELPDGTLGWLGLQFGTWDDLDVMADTLLERHPDDDSSERQLFGFLDDWQPMFVPCGHFQQPESHFGVDNVHEWTHANSLDWDEPSDTYYLGSRLHDAILAIDGDSGEVAWQMGGLRSDFTFERPRDAWSHGHFSQMWPGGLLMFDNALHEDRPSRVIEYTYDEDARTVQSLWEITAPGDGAVSFLGDARKLSGGNVVVVWNTLGLIEEITPQGEVVWQLTTDPALSLGRVWPIGDLYAP